MANSICATCGNAIFVAVMGEHKCGLNKITYSNLTVCGDHKPGTPQESKANEDYYREMEDEQC